MNGTALQELLQSPLDDVPSHRRVHPIVAFTVAAIVASATTFAVTSVVDDRSTAATTTTTTATTVAATPLVDGVLDLADGATGEQVAWWSTDDRVHGMVTTILPPGADPEEAEPLTTGDWTLRLTDGRTIPGREAVSRGVFTLEFEGPGLTIDQADTLVFRALDSTLDETVRWTEPEARFPWSPTTETLASIETDGGTASVVLDAARFDDMGGEARWHLEGDLRARATVDVVVDYLENGSPERIVSSHGLPFAFLQLEAGPQTPTLGGVVELFHLDDPEEPSYRSRFWGDEDPVDVTDVEVTWTVTFWVYGDDAAEAIVEAG